MFLPDTLWTYRRDSQIIKRGIAIMSPMLDGVTAFFGRLKDVKEIILVIVFFVSAVVSSINYFATRESLDNYKCINDLTISMLINTSSADFLEQVVRSSRKDLRQTEDTLRDTPSGTPAHRSIAEAFDEQKANLEKLQANQKEAEKAKDTALKKLQAIQLGNSKLCSKEDSVVHSPE